MSGAGSMSMTGFSPELHEGPIQNTGVLRTLCMAICGLCVFMSRLRLYL